MVIVVFFRIFDKRSQKGIVDQRLEGQSLRSNAISTLVRKPSKVLESDSLRMRVVRRRKQQKDDIQRDSRARYGSKESIATAQFRVRSRRSCCEETVGRRGKNKNWPKSKKVGRELDSTQHDASCAPTKK